MRWALTKFAFDVYDESEKEVSQDNSNVESAESL